MTIHSWPWLLAAIVVTLLFIAAAGFALRYLVRQMKPDREEVLALIGMLAFVVLCTAGVAIAVFGYGYGLTGAAPK